MKSVSGSIMMFSLGFRLNSLSKGVENEASPFYIGHLPPNVG